MLWISITESLNNVIKDVCMKKCVSFYYYFTDPPSHPFLGINYYLINIPGCILYMLRNLIHLIVLHFFGYTGLVQKKSTIVMEQFYTLCEYSIIYFFSHTTLFIFRCSSFIEQISMQSSIQKDMPFIML